MAVAAAGAVEHVGLPEAQLNLAEAAIYLALAPKSNAVLTALAAARKDVREHGNARPPKSLRSTGHPGQRKLGHGEGYVYPHDDPAGFEVDYLPEGLKGPPLLRPGLEELENPRAESARHELDRKLRGLVLAVEDRVHLDDVERPDEAGLGHELHREMRLAIGQPAADGGADAGGDVGIDDVEIEAHVDEAGAGDVCERLPHRLLDPEPVEVAHREDERAQLAEQHALRLVERANPDERDASRIDGRQRP